MERILNCDLAFQNSAPLEMEIAGILRENKADPVSSLALRIVAEVKEWMLEEVRSQRGDGLMTRFYYVVDRQTGMVTAAQTTPEYAMRYWHPERALIGPCTAEELRRILRAWEGGN